MKEKHVGRAVAGTCSAFTLGSTRLMLTLSQFKPFFSAQVAMTARAQEGVNWSGLTGMVGGSMAADNYWMEQKII